MTDIIAKDSLNAELANIHYIFDKAGNRTDIIWNHLGTNAHYRYTGNYWLTKEEMFGNTAGSAGANETTAQAGGLASPFSAEVSATPVATADLYNLIQDWAYDNAGNRDSQVLTQLPQL